MAETLSLLEDHGVECLITVYCLPDGTGLELFETVQSRYSLPFILCPADATEALGSDALSAVLDDYILKQRGVGEDRVSGWPSTKRPANITVGINVDSTPDEGTTVSFTLPDAGPDDDPRRD